MVRSNYRYNQLEIGDCGHPVWGWPLVAEFNGSNPRAVCEECTKEKYAIDGDESVQVWVRLKPKAEIPEKTPSKPKREKKPKPLTPWQQLLQQEGMF